MAQGPTELPWRARVRLAARVTILATREIGRILWLVTRRTLEALLAVIIAFEEWGWKPLAALLASIAHLAPIAWIERLIQRLPPYGALAVFVVPAIVLVPLKLLALFLIATGHTISAALLFIGAKVVGTAIVARLFHLTEAQLVRIPWCKRALDIVMPWKDELVAWVRTTWAWRHGRVAKGRVKHLARPLVAWLSRLVLGVR